MSAATKEAPVTMQYSQADLRNKRIAIYKKHVAGGVPSVFLTINNAILIPANEINRSKNFKIFVGLYLYKGITANNDEWSNTISPIGLNASSMGYKALERYAKTDYGSAVIKEIVSHPKKYKGFSIEQGRGLHAKGDYLIIYLPEKFPNGSRFKIGGQKIYDLAIIHHEFVHAMLPQSKGITIRDELWAVRKAENPVRLKRGGGRYEPRYVYYNGSKTINIITGKSLPLQWSVSKYDPRVMVKLNDKDAL